MSNFPKGYIDMFLWLVSPRSYIPMYMAKVSLELADALDKTKVGSLTLDHIGVRHVSAAKQHEHACSPMLACFAR